MRKFLLCLVPAAVFFAHLYLVQFEYLRFLGLLFPVSTILLPGIGIGLSAYYSGSWIGSKLPWGVNLNTTTGAFGGLVTGFAYSVFLFIGCEIAM